MEAPGSNDMRNIPSDGWGEIPHRTLCASSSHFDTLKLSDPPQIMRSVEGRSAEKGHEAMNLTRPHIVEAY